MQGQRLAVLSILTLATLVEARTPAFGQALPSSPITLAGGRITLGGELAASVAAGDDGFFNYSDYKRNLLRVVRVSLSGAWQPSAHLALLGEVRAFNWNTVRPYALYARVRPWADRTIDIQAGLIPPTFGTFGRRTYGADNPLIGYPLAYQYPTSLRADAVPATADDLLRMRGRGWLTNYPVGSSERDIGLPLVSALRWDTGVQVRAAHQPFEASAALTVGTLSNPRTRDDNGGKQVSARLAWRPRVGLIAGASAARGAYLSRRAVDPLPPDQRTGVYDQRAWGVDLEYSRDRWIVRAEAVASRWRLPAVRAPFIRDPLKALALSIEGRYGLRPGMYAAARFDRLTFSRIAGTLFEGQPTTWDAPTTRLEAGGGYYLRRNVVAKAVYQRNWRDGGRVRDLTLVSAQLLFWF